MRPLIEPPWAQQTPVIANAASSQSKNRSQMTTRMHRLAMNRLLHPENLCKGLNDLAFAAKVVGQVECLIGNGYRPRRLHVVLPTPNELAVLLVCQSLYARPDVLAEVLPLDECMPFHDVGLELTPPAKGFMTNDEDGDVLVESLIEQLEQTVRADSVSMEYDHDLFELRQQTPCGPVLISVVARGIARLSVIDYELVHGFPCTCSSTGFEVWRGVIYCRPELVEHNATRRWEPTRSIEVGRLQAQRLERVGKFMESLESGKWIRFVVQSAVPCRCPHADVQYLALLCNLGQWNWHRKAVRVAAEIDLEVLHVKQSALPPFAAHGPHDGERLARRKLEDEVDNMWVKRMVKHGGFDDMDGG